MLIPLTDPEHPLSKQMLQLITDHQARTETIEARPVIDDIEALRHRRGRTVVSRVLARPGLVGAAPVI